MAKYYSLLPLPQGKFAEIPLVERAVFGLIWERWKLGSYKLMGGCDDWYDHDEEDIFCIYAHNELARMIGVSEKTIRRSLILLRDKYHMIRWRKAKFMGACQYYVERDVQQELIALQQSNKKAAESP